MKLLLADDDKDQLALRKIVLVKAGFQVCTACDEETALRLAEQESPQIAVIDLRMPTQEAGLRIIRALKKLDHTLRLFVLTGVNAKRLDSLPERFLIEAVITKGGGSRELLSHLKRKST